MRPRLIPVPEHNARLLRGDELPVRGAVSLSIARLLASSIAELDGCLGYENLCQVTDEEGGETGILNVNFRIRKGSRLASNIKI